MPFDAKGDSRNADGRGKQGVKIIAGNSNRPLAESICSYLKLPMAKAQVKRFADMAIAPDGSSSRNLSRLAQLLSKRQVLK